MATLKINDIILPEPVQISSSDEIIWSSNTGRVANGSMVGDVVAEKKNVTITWGILTEMELKEIKDNLVSGFFPFTFRDDGKEITITSYRGTLSKEHLGKMLDGIYYYKSATVNIIQK